MSNRGIIRKRNQIVKLLSKRDYTFNEIHSKLNLKPIEAVPILKDLETKKIIQSSWKKEFNEKDGHTRITKIFLTNSQNFSKLKSTNHLTIKQNKTFTKNSKWNQNEFS